MTYSPTVPDPTLVSPPYLSNMFILMYRVGMSVDTLLKYALPILQRNTAAAQVTAGDGTPRVFADEAIASLAYAINIDLTTAWQAVHANRVALGLPFVYGLPPSIGYALSPIDGSVIDVIGAQLLLGQSQQIVGQAGWGSVAYIDGVRVSARLGREVEVCKQASLGLTTPAQQLILAPLWAAIEKLYYTPGDAQTSLRITNQGSELPASEGPLTMNAPATTERLTTGGIMTCFDRKNGFRSTEIGTKATTIDEYRQLEKDLASAADSLGDVDWSKFGQPGAIDDVPCDIEIRLQTAGDAGFAHGMSLRYTIHGTQKWQMFTKAVLQLTSQLGFVRDSAK